MKKINCTIFMVLLMSLAAMADIPPHLKTKPTDIAVKTKTRIDHVVFSKQINDTIQVYTGMEYDFKPFKNFVVEEGYSLRVDSIQTSEYCRVLGFTDSTITIQMGLKPMPYKAFFSFFFQVIDPNGEVVDYGTIYKTRQKVFFANFHAKGAVLNANNIETIIQAQEIQFLYSEYNGFGGQIPDYDYTAYNYPKGTTKSPICAMSHWIGGLDQDSNLYVSATNYTEPLFGYTAGPYSKTNNELYVDEYADGVSKWTTPYKVTTQEIAYHIAHYTEADYQMPEAIANWPAHGNTELGQRQHIAPFSDVNGDGVYTPLEGDFPKIKGDQMIFYSLNDKSEESGLGVDIDTKSYAFAKDQNEDSVLANTTFYQYIFHNRSNISYNNVYLGIWIDMDIGYAQDDYMGTNVETGYIYAYNGLVVDGAGNADDEYGTEIPAQAAMILGGPAMDADQTDNPNGGCDYSITGINFGNGIADDERLGVTSSIYYTYSNYQETPMSPHGYYNNLRGLRTNNTPFQYGGDAYETGVVGPATRFVFPGDSDPMNWSTNGVLPNDGYNQNGKYWTEKESGNSPKDMRCLMSVGPFSFEAGSVDTLDFALVTAPAQDNIAATLTTLQNYCERLKADYTKDPSHYGDNPVGIFDYKQPNYKLYVYPNPINGDYLHVQSPQTDKLKEYAIYSVSGALLHQGTIDTQNSVQKIYVGHLSQGAYIIRCTSVNNNVLQSKFIK